MPSGILDGLSLIDTTGRLILSTTLASLVLGIGANLFTRARYAGIARDLRDNAGSGRFASAVLADTFRRAGDAARRSAEPNTQAIIEEGFQSGLGSLLLAERFARAATGLVIILGLLGTFYGLTSSIGRLVQLVAGDGGSVTDAMQGVTTGLTQALSGMAVAFSNSLVGVLSAVILTLVGIFSNLTDLRVGLMISVETTFDRLLAEQAGPPGTNQRTDGLERAVAGFGASIARLEASVGRFESALVSFSTTTRDFSEFNAHLKDNVQRMSLSFGDLSETLKNEIVARKRTSGSED
jgi:hypothetical protein